mmetsp:Transcript_10618/g.29276  ORF Transcript_10618/g.29276 Transcript_10618/m.29276 type:complete len:301 (-) Transcript_10618:198-1100(-)|eukprot:CAMPEP_0168780266 /NCGR_PEP_ID=MMETSP0725-20121227/8031_1 /TAXON_ID=265536 /ORGANISM="Amphiprora sp., Strain CCMP467" /LENGTH=300 /DNA_ID=CAMNT_0008830105 /DNA_START=5 /DNA_END=907 /DNA_ORIENTATION=+
MAVPALEPRVVASSTPKPLTYSKRLQGVRATPELQSLVQRAVARVQQDQRQRDLSNDDTNENDSTTRQQFATTTTTLLEYNASSSTNTNAVIPIRVLRAAAAALQDDADWTAALTTSLAFTPPPPPPASHKAYQARLQRLRWQQEETKYGKLTRNVMDAKAFQQDDQVTTKSMTYAASIGLNMIVAPLSFGCFMYFFGGHWLSFLWNSSGATTTNDDTSNHHNNNNDIPRVIISVVSGVVMLFIEMILFVIRTHEMDQAVRSKQAKQKKSQKGGGAFGPYTANTVRHYTDKDKSSSKKAE